MTNMTTQEILQGIRNWVLSKIGHATAKTAYCICTTRANVAAKTANLDGYVLSLGGSIKILMSEENTVNNATLNINSTGAKPLFYDGERASASNSWEAGETVEVYYNGTSYYANNVAGGGKFFTGEKVKEVGIDNEPTEDSERLVTSGGVFGAIADVDAKVSAAIAGVKVSLAVSPTVIYKGESQSITLTGTMSNGTPTSMKLFDGSTQLKATAATPITHTISGLTLSDNSKAYRVEGVTLGMTLTATASVAARYPIYYGFGATASAVKVKSNKYAATTSANHTYERTLAAGSSNQYFYLLVPTDITAPAVGDFTMNKAPFVVTKNPSGDTVTGYNVYRSANQYAAGTTIKAEVG